MAKLPKSQPKLLPILIFLSLFSLHYSSTATLSTQTIIDRIKIFDTNPDILKAFTNNTNIFVTVTVVNGDVPAVAELPAAKSWVANNILPFHLQTKINLIAPILDFHRKTKSSFLINSYPFFEYTDKTLDYALFKPNDSVLDKVTGLTYTNMFDVQLDAVYSVMEEIRYGDVDIVVVETRWPFKGDPNQPDANKNYALSYIANLVKHVNSGQGTLLMPYRTFPTYIYGLFNKNLKPNTSEQNFGLFNPGLQRGHFTK